MLDLTLLNVNDMENLTEKGFVFTDDNLYYRCCKLQGEAWFMRWDEDQEQWKTLRSVSENEVEAARQKKEKVKSIDPLKIYQYVVHLGTFNPDK